MSADLDSTLVECGPLEPGARVASDVLPSEQMDMGAVLQAMQTLTPEGPPLPDLVLVAVPKGDGVAVENAIRRMLKVSAS